MIVVNYAKENLDGINQFITQTNSKNVNFLILAITKIIMHANHVNNCIVLVVFALLNQMNVVVVLK